MYQYPIINETVSLVRNLNFENVEKTIITGENGEFELRQSLSLNDFSSQANSIITLALHIDISNQLIKTFPFQITQDFLHSSSITFDFTNKVLEQSTKVKSYINGSVEDKSTLKSISGAQVEVIYYYPMLMAKRKIETNKVGYFEFQLDLDFFEVIIADLIVSKEGYQPFKASEDPKFIQQKGIALYDKYSYTFVQSIKLVRQE